MSIDTVAFTILRCIQEHGKPLWKNRIYECQADVWSEKVSVQTVGRRVDQLRDDGYLESCIIAPDDIKRDLIIAFKLTDKGREAVQQKRRDLLRQQLHHDIFGVEKGDRLENDMFRRLLREEFELSQENEAILDEHSRDELLALLVLYFVGDEIGNILSTEQIDEFVQHAQQHDELVDSLTGQNLGPA